MKNKHIIFALLLLTIFTNEVSAEELSQFEGVVSFQRVIQVPSVAVPVPTVVEVPLSESVFSGERYYVFDRQTLNPVGSYVKSRAVVEEVPVLIETSPTAYNPIGMSDSNRDTYTEFSLPENGEGTVTITVKTPKPITTSKLQLYLSPHVALPKTVQIESYDLTTSQRQIALAKSNPEATTVYFPEVTSDYFFITFEYVQPLRIAEFELVQDGTLTGYQKGLRFLAQPGHAYSIYYGADRTVSVPVAESGNLTSDNEVLLLPAYSPEQNSYYLPADVDGDGVRDILDNCVNVQNADQIDIDRNGRGDVCDDWDRDGRENRNDNCINLPNSTQLDVDHDGIGDACDIEESRFTERNKWVPWVGMATAVMVLLILFALVARNPEIKHKEKKEE